MSQPVIKFSSSTGLICHPAKNCWSAFLSCVYFTAQTARDICAVLKVCPNLNVSVTSTAASVSCTNKMNTTTQRLDLHGLFPKSPLFEPYPYAQPSSSNGNVNLVFYPRSKGSRVKASRAINRIDIMIK